MRLNANLLVTLLLLSIIVALTAGLIVESVELQQLTESSRGGNCAALQSEFSHLRFIGYHLGLLIAAIAAIAYIAFMAVWLLLRRLIDLVSGRAI